MVEMNTVLIIIGSILVLVKSASYVIKAASNLAKEFGITDYLIGFAIVALGTSLPELMTAIFGSIAGKSELVLGDLIGANILDTTVVLGLMAVVGRRIKIEGKMFSTFDTTLFMTLSIVVLPLLLGIDGRISRIDGIVLLGAYSIYLYRLIEREETFRHRKHLIPLEIWKDILTFIVALPLLLLSAKFLVTSVSSIIEEFHFSSYIGGMILLAVGTTLPELTVEVSSAWKGIKNIGFGDVIGSIMVNSSLILGLAAVINPILIPKTAFITSILFMLTSTFVALLFLQKEIVTWKEGLALILIYITFIVSEVIIL